MANAMVPFIDPEQKFGFADAISRGLDAGNKINAIRQQRAAQDKAGQINALAASIAPKFQTDKGFDMGGFRNALAASLVKGGMAPEGLGLAAPAGKPDLPYHVGQRVKHRAAGGKEMESTFKGLDQSGSPVFSDSIEIPERDSSTGESSKRKWAKERLKPVLFGAVNSILPDRDKKQRGNLAALPGTGFNFESELSLLPKEMQSRYSKALDAIEEGKMSPEQAVKAFGLESMGPAAPAGTGKGAPAGAMKIDPSKFKPATR